jgi:hypothetical protein
LRRALLRDPRGVAASPLGCALDWKLDRNRRRGGAMMDTDFTTAKAANLWREGLAALASDRRQTPLGGADQKHRVLWSTSAARGSFALVPSNDLKQPGRSVSEPYGTVRGDRMVADVMDAGAVAL